MVVMLLFVVMSAPSPYWETASSVRCISGDSPLQPFCSISAMAELIRSMDLLSGRISIDTSSGFPLMTPPFSLYFWKAISVTEKKSASFDQPAFLFPFLMKSGVPMVSMSQTATSFILSMFWMAS